MLARIEGQRVEAIALALEDNLLRSNEVRHVAPHLRHLGPGRKIHPQTRGPVLRHGQDQILRQLRPARARHGLKLRLRTPRLEARGHGIGLRLQGAAIRENRRHAPGIDFARGGRGNLRRVAPRLGRQLHTALGRRAQAHLARLPLRKDPAALVEDPAPGVVEGALMALLQAEAAGHPGEVGQREGVGLGRAHARGADVGLLHRLPRAIPGADLHIQAHPLGVVRAQGKV